MVVLNNWYKNSETDKIYWIDNPDNKGEWLFSFDKKKGVQYVC